MLTQDDVALMKTKLDETLAAARLICHAQSATQQRVAEDALARVRGELHSVLEERAEDLIVLAEREIGSK